MFVISITNDLKIINHHSRQPQIPFTNNNKHTSIMNNKNQKELDHVTNRVILSTITGFFSGGSHAIIKGYPAPRASIQASISCALAGTACFGIERIVHTFVLPSLLTLSMNHDGAKEQAQTQTQTQAQTQTQTQMQMTKKQSLYISHTVGGIIGGGLLGGIFQRRVGSGIMLFTPLMIGAAYGEIRFQLWKEDQIQQLIVKEQKKQFHSSKS